MKLVSGKAILSSLDSDAADSLFIDPLLDRQAQITATGIDLRLGYDFLVSIVTRRPSIELLPSDNSQRRSIGSYFQETRRDLGDTFVLYPGQVVLTTTLEYVSVPKNMIADVVTRSSFNRLGVHLSTSVQPGYRGSISLELFNYGPSPIELVIGGRLVELRLYDLSGKHEYIDAAKAPRKYLATVRPVVSQADRDRELEPLAKIRERRIQSGLP